MLCVGMELNIYKLGRVKLWVKKLIKKLFKFREIYGIYVEVIVKLFYGDIFII